ncbi:MAG: hybrid sensor histidine kinase/response regulator [Spirochaetes bacterium]|nr:MAG: hybrid sensor histidine kinase/response regulator [Spirochaetota bacterium]
MLIAPRERPQARMDKSAITILVVDDEEKILSRLERILAKEGYRTDTSPNGADAAAKISGTEYDIVLTDINMPDKSGFEIMEHIRVTGSAALPLVLTGYASVESAIRAIKLGAYDFIQKPIDAETLKLVVHRAAERVLLARQNEQNLKELKTLNELKDEFLSVVSHDLRSPLSAIGGYANYLMKKDIQPAHRRYLEIIAEIASNLYSLVNELLDVTRIETGVIRLDKEETDLGELIDKSIMNFIILASDKNTSIRFHNALANPLAKIDRMKILQTVNNLINNAVKFTENGTITIRAGEQDGEDGIIVSIQDTGVGMHPDHLARLFDKYALFHKEGTRGEGGTGLGLVICKRFIELHGGSIRVTSDAGLGSTFEFTLPREGVS